MRASSIRDTDVLIIGAGPTGLVLALWLTRLGVRARIVDKTAESGTTSRALAVQARTLELGQSSAGGFDAVLLRYDAAGNEVWTRQFGTDGNHFDGVRCVATDSAWVYVAGQTNGAFPGQVSAGGFDAWVRKFDTDSNAVWTTQFGTSRLDVPFGVAVHATGVYVTGQTRGIFAGQTSAGGVDVFLAKLDGAGNVVWIRQFGSSGRDVPNDLAGVAVDDSGVYAALRAGS